MIRRRLMRVLLSIVASAFLLLALASNAKADTISGLQMKGLGNYVGKYLTVYYAIGSRASINTQEDQIHLRQVKLKKTIPITSDVINLPAVNIERTLFFLPYNIMVFVVHDGVDFRWVNADTSIPDGEEITGPTQYLSVDSLMKTEFDQMQSSQNYQFGTLK